MEVKLKTVFIIMSHQQYGSSFALRAAAALLAGAALAGCGEPPTDVTVLAEDPTDVPLRASSMELASRFNVGDATFDVVYRPPDGLGPAYIRSSCASCHEAAAKGPGLVQKMVLVEDDGVTAAADQSALGWGHTVRPFVAGGATTPLLPPAGLSSLKLSSRSGVPVFGRGYMEAVADSEIERVAAEQARRGDGIAGRVNRVVYTSERNPDERFHRHGKGDAGLIGRFGLKARIATLDDFSADAAQGDMSITSPLRPAELPYPDGRTDDLHPGPDVSADIINELADYMRLLEIPRRAQPSERGPLLFAQAQCSVCHVPALRTRADYPFAPLANTDAPIFSDLLLHDMGDALADGLAAVGSHLSAEEAIETVLGRIACHSVIRVGRGLTTAEVTRLLADLDALAYGSNCPHGRPVSVEFSRGQIERMFGR